MKKRPDRWNKRLDSPLDFLVLTVKTKQDSKVS